MYGPSGAPIWTSPNIDKKRRYVYVGTGENYSTPADDSSDAIIAYNIDTGEEVWRRQTLSGDAWNLACMAKVCQIVQKEMVQIWIIQQALFR